MQIQFDSKLNDGGVNRMVTVGYGSHFLTTFFLL